MMQVALRASCFVFAMAVLTPVPSLAQSSNDLQVLLERLQRLERDVRTLNVQVARGVSAESAQNAIGSATDEGANLPAMARIEVRMGALEEDVRSATGRMEELSFRMRELATQMETYTNDTTFRLEALENGAAQQPSSGLTQQIASQPSLQPAPQSTGAGVQPVAPAGGSEQSILGTVTPEEVAAVQAQSTQPAMQTAGLTPEDQYKQAFGVLRQARYDDAQVALQGFLAQNDGHRLEGNARYWLGETYYVRGLYLEAAETFLAGYQTDPKGAKAPDALLKLGMSLGGLEQKTEACSTFAKLAREYPKPGPGIAGALARESQRYGC